MRNRHLNFDCLLCVAGAPSVLRADHVMIESAQSAHTKEIKLAMEDAGRVKKEGTLQHNVRTSVPTTRLLLHINLPGP